MSTQVEASIYDYPVYYDLLFGSDVASEFRFLKACFGKHAGCEVKSLFEPACGTGRLLIKLGRGGYGVSGNDLNPKAVDYCNQRLAKYDLPQSVVVGDMSDFRVRRKFDAAFNMINTFRHLPTEEQALGHLQCMAKGMTKGGLYILGIHLEPTACKPMQEESWSARRGNLVVNSHMWSKGIDRKTRLEHLGIHIDVFTPTSRLRIVDHMEYRTYKYAEFTSLLEKVPALEIAETYDFEYNIRRPHVISGQSEDVVFVLRRR
ncbi:MAG: class I SAM-dependent methyltransferase [Planctomycetia bacterium]